MGTNIPIARSIGLIPRLVINNLGSLCGAAFVITRSQPTPRPREREFTSFRMRTLYTHPVKGKTRAMCRERDPVNGELTFSLPSIDLFPILQYFVIKYNIIILKIRVIKWKKERREREREIYIIFIFFIFVNLRKRICIYIRRIEWFMGSKSV